MRRVELLIVVTACAAGRVTAPPVALPKTQTFEADVQTGPLLLRDDVAYVADEDPPSVRAFDARGLEELWAVTLDAAPAHLALGDARVFASLRAEGRVDVIDTKAHTASMFAKPCVEPIGLAVDARGELLVACGWSHELVALSSSGAKSWSVDLPYEPRAVLVKDGRAYVSHASGGKLSVVDVKTHAARTIALSAGLVSEGAPKNVPFGPTALGLRLEASNGFALAEHDGTVYASEFVGSATQHQFVSQTYYGGTFEDGVVYRFDATYDKAWLAAQLVTRTAQRGCLAPRGVAVRSESRTLVACPGEDTLVEQAPDGAVVRRIFVGAGPSAVVVDARRDAALVWSQRARTLTRVDLGTGARVARLATGESETSFVLRRGREIFEATNDRRITSDGRGCVTCHPDGRSDGFTWGTPEGPRQTLMLAGRLQGTAPYGWMRRSPTLHDYVKETMSRLQGIGLPPDDLDALVRYIETLRAPHTTELADVSKGRAIFESRQAGCASCHAGKQLTDGRSHRLDLEPVDTPSLLYLSHTAPYFHDGRYDTIDELLTDTDGMMGHTKQLSTGDRSALTAYLLSL